MESMYWKSNKKWYRVNFETGGYELTQFAPPRAIDSFNLYLRKNGSKPQQRDVRTGTRVSEEQKQEYSKKVYEEMRNRGFAEEEIPRVIGKTGFLDAINEYPEEQLHYSIEDAVDEIICTAAKA